MELSTDSMVTFLSHQLSPGEIARFLTCSLRWKTGLCLSLPCRHDPGHEMDKLRLFSPGPPVPPLHQSTFYLYSFFRVHLRRDLHLTTRGAPEEVCLPAIHHLPIVIRSPSNKAVFSALQQDISCINIRRLLFCDRHRLHPIRLIDSL
nr:hypothetical protein CFP56_77464 [Quercus suber]